MPLVVDLDGTLVRTDTLHESLLVLLKRNPLLLVLAALWMLKGKAAFKAEVGRRVKLDAARLPYSEPLLAYLREEKARGRRLVLATAADQTIADAVAAHLDLFSEVYASDGTVNLSGARKLARLKQAHPEFDYAGDGEVDLALWREARRAVVVHGSTGLERKVRALGRGEVRVFEAPRTGVRTWVKALRVHQWAKNILRLRARRCWRTRGCRPELLMQVGAGLRGLQPVRLQRVRPQRLAGPGLGPAAPDQAQAPVRLGRACR